MYQKALKGLRVMPADEKSLAGKQHPVWLCGMFRSGTSVMAKQLAVLGLDPGNKKHLLGNSAQHQQTGVDGFYENFLFMDLSVYMLRKLNAAGDRPSVRKDLGLLTWDVLTNEELIRMSVFEIMDQRISLKKKVEIFRHYGVSNIVSYLENNFIGRPMIKNPHISLLIPLFESKWKNSVFIVMVREPEKVVSSALAVTPASSYGLYCDFLSHFRTEFSDNLIFFSYDHLVADPVSSLSVLTQALSLKSDKINEAAQIIQKPSAEKKVQLNNDRKKEAYDLYEYLLSKCINNKK